MIDPTRRAFRMVTGTVAAAACLGLVATGGHPVSPTDAAWQDTEHVQTTGMGYWPTYYANISAGSAKSSSVLTTTKNYPYIENLKFRMGNTGRDSAVAGPDSSTGGGRFVSRWDQFWRQPRPSPTDTPYIDDAAANSANPLTQDLNKDPGATDPHNWKAANNFDSGGARNGPQNYRCLYGSGNYRPVTTDTSRCAIGAGNYTAAKNNTLYYGFMWSNGGNYAFLNAANITTAVRCGPDGGVADPPGGRVDIGEGDLNNGDARLNYTAGGDNKNPRWRKVVDDGKPGTNTVNSNTTSFTNGRLSTWAVSGSNGVIKAMPLITQKSVSGASGQPYALSEIAVYAEFYYTSGTINQMEKTPRNKMYFVISRSECGVRRGDSAHQDAALPPAAPDIEALAMPGGNGLTPYSGTNFTPNAQPAAVARSLRAAGQPTATGEDTTSSTAATPPTAPTPTAPDPTASTSPAGTANPAAQSQTPTAGPELPTDATTTVTTTDALPPSETTVASTTVAQTTTSAPPAIPTRPERLSANEVTTVCAPATVDGRSVEVVVKGTECPADAADGAAALSLHAGGGAVVDPHWKTVDSADPETDGWRYAAIEQTTGATLYIR